VVESLRTGMFWLEHTLKKGPKPLAIPVPFQGNLPGGATSVVIHGRSPSANVNTSRNERWEHSQPAFEVAHLAA